MKKIFLALVFLLLLVSSAGAQWWGISGTGGGTGADANAYYLVLRATSAPTNATSLGGLTTGLVLCTVADSVCTPSTVAITANGTSLITAADYAAMKALLDLEIGTDVQAYDADTVTSSGTITADHATCWSADGATIIACGAKVALDDDIVTGLLYYNSVSGEVENPPATLSIATNILTTGYLGGRALGIIVPKPSGTSTDVPSETVLTHADDGSATDAYVGMTLYNVTDSVSGTVTASTSTTITVAAGGMSWANTNVYQLGPGPAQSGSIFYVGAAGTLRHPATVGYVAGYYATAAASIIVNPASDTMVITHATAAAIDAGDAIDSPATAGSFIWLHNASATLAYTHGKNGTWTDGGAD